jgi:hypothetical protein
METAMHTSNPANLASPTTRPHRRLIVLVDDQFPGRDEFRESWIAARAQGAEVLVIAPALPVPGERWIIDLDARQAQARAHLASWVEALADTAASVRGEVGAESPSLAVADALAAFAADEYLDARLPAAPSPPRRRPLDSVRELFGAAPVAGPLRVGHP